MDQSERKSRLASCVIAGAGPGLGLAIAERYAGEGFTAYALYPRPELLAPGIAGLWSRGLRVAAVECDVDDPDVVEQAIRSIEAEACCDVLVYNAFVENGQRANIGSALTCVNAVVTGMQAKGDGAILFSTFAGTGESAVRALAQRLAQESEAFGIRVGMVTIEGALPTAGTELTAIANLYWDLFISPDHLYEREVRVRTNPPREPRRFYNNGS
jgi:NAD(P)-dependent dehydrogenase (short-subunit alcohol dehydrogenase family)